MSSIDSEPLSRKRLLLTDELEGAPKSKRINLDCSKTMDKQKYANFSTMTPNGMRGSSFGSKPGTEKKIISIKNFQGKQSILHRVIRSIIFSLFQYVLLLIM